MRDLWFIITLPFRLLRVILEALIKTGGDDADNVH